MPPKRLTASLMGAFVLVALACASRQKGTAVTIVRYREAVGGCDFLGRLVPDTAAEGSIPQGQLRQRVVELGGDTLLLLPAGSAEAWNCRARQERVYVEGGFRATPTPPFRPTTPRPTPGLAG